MFRKAFAAALFCGAAFAAAPAVPTIDQSLSMKSVAGSQISPDGRYVAYTVQQANWDENEFATQIWIANTASGERFNEKALTAAHPTLPFETRVRVINLTTGKSVIVRINDRNATYTQRVIDLSRKAGEMIGIHYQGIGTVALIPELPEPMPIPVATQPPVAPVLERTATEPSPVDLTERRRPS